MVTNFQSAKIQNREALRQGLLDAASRLLAEKGLEALNMREVAKEINASTKVLYTLFGGKEGLLDALYQEGFIRLRAALEAVSSKEPLARLGLISQVYRQFALENPHYYAILMNLYNKGYKPSEQSMQLASDSFEVLGECIQECIDANIMTGEAEMISITLWACMHGEISLELGGNFYKYSQSWREQLFEMTVQNIIKGFFSKAYLLKTLGVSDLATDV